MYLAQEASVLNGGLNGGTRNYGESMDLKPENSSLPMRSNSDRVENAP